MIRLRDIPEVCQPHDESWNGAEIIRGREDGLGRR